MESKVFRWLFFISIFGGIVAVDRSKFKTCDESGFCKRCRKYRPEISPFRVQGPLNMTDEAIVGEIENKETGVFYSFLLQFLLDSTIRLRINDDAYRVRYQPLFALVMEPLLDKYEVVAKESTFTTIKVNNNKYVLFHDPFKIECYSNGLLMLVVNDLGRFMFEHGRPKTDSETNENGEWEENYHEHADSKPYGPMAIAMDFSFPHANHAYGISSHAERLSLRSTTNSDPYRLYNLDVFEYELNEKMALYGAVPYLIGHSLNGTAGVFWLNSAETWVDIEKKFETKSNENVMEKIVNFVSRGSNPILDKGVDAYFMSETGIMDIFIAMGPSFYYTVRQFSRLTGTAPVPQYFSLGYHQSRWNYFDQVDVETVSDNFDKHDIPMDVMWLDIEYTHDKKYFTWEPTKFSEPEKMIEKLVAKGRKLVVIIDPHIKRDNYYKVHNDATNLGYYVKNKDGNDYEGWCWPGSSSYLDFINPAVGEYYSSMYNPENFEGTTNDVYIWNDMNEPSVFNGPEVTMHKDAVHFGNWEHRDIHNIYGFTQVMQTYEGLMKRSKGNNRPFILTRAHFAGIQRYAAIWTGDNAASWDHLKFSIPMCLSSAITGISFCGADVGGFFNNPDSQLLYRWYQAGAYLPFYRAHAHIDTKRREPWLFDTETVSIIRKAIRDRQELVPFWYTLFFEHFQLGSPVIRPMVMEFPYDSDTFEMDDQFLIGNYMMVKPVTEPDVTQIMVYLPSGNRDVWYEKETLKKVTDFGYITVPVTPDYIPAFYRGGSIIPIRKRIRRSLSLTMNDPYTLIVSLDNNGTADGQLYVDDGKSFEYRTGQYVYIRFMYLNNQLLAKFLDKGRFNSLAWIEKVVILGAPNIFKKAIIRRFGSCAIELKKKNFNASEIAKDSAVHTMNSGLLNNDMNTATNSTQNSCLTQEELEVKYDLSNESLTIRRPGVLVSEEWAISLH